MFGAGNEARTRDLNLGKVALYQLSYSRVFHITRRCSVVFWNGQIVMQFQAEFVAPLKNLPQCLTASDLVVAGTAVKAAAATSSSLKGTGLASKATSKT